MDVGCWDLTKSQIKRLCTFNNIPDNSFAKLSTTVKHIDLSNVNVQTIESQAFVGLEGLETLDLSNNQIISLPEKVFEQLRNIREIILFWNQLANFIFDVFANNLNLQKVNLSYNNITTLASIQHRGEFNIKELDLSSNDLINISELCRVKKLEILKLDYNQKLDFKTFKSNCWTELKILSLQATNLKSLNNSYRLLVGLDKLKILNLARNGLEILNIGNFPEMSKLIYLDISGNTLKTVSARDLKRKFIKLNRFDMEDNPWDCKNFDNLTDTFKALKITIDYFGFPRCFNANVLNSNYSEIFNESNSILYEHSWLIFALQMVLTVILFIVDISFSIYIYVAE
jgi:Leucine-rich repeat (LRR) protein